MYSVKDKVTVIAKTDTGYFKFSDGSFIHGDYLSDSKVIRTTVTTAKKTETRNKSDSFYSKYSYGSKQYLCELCGYHH